MTRRAAECHCGQLRLSCEGEPRKISMCHCLDCQRRTGSAFSVAVFYDRDKVQIEAGKSETYQRDSASGHAVRFHFCGNCGSNLFWEPERLPDLIGVAIGGFADPGFAAPEQSVWTRDRHEWLSRLDGIPAHDVNPVRG
jgi:hypothetical protein